MAREQIKLKPFEPTIEWWRHFLAAHKCEELARQFADDGCWSDVKKAYKLGQIPDAVAEAAIEAVAQCDRKHSFLAFTVMRIIGPRDELIDKIAQSENAEAAYAYCRQFGDDLRLRAIVRDKGDEKTAFYYCRDVANVPEVARVILKGRNESIRRRFAREVR